MESYISRDERLRKMFERVAVMELSDEKKQEVGLEIRDHIEGDFPYWSQVCLSSVIATFGLLQNSVAVIIGAMLIAPLLLPIKGIAFGISTGQTHLFWRSVVLLAKSVTIAIFLAYCVVILLPFELETSEILARTSPNLIDFLVAIASAIIAFLAVYFNELSESIGGVAMATALMPPLAVTGIELALGFADKSWGSFFLFITNLFSIVFVGMLMFFMYGFMPHQESHQKNTLKQIGVLSVLGLLIIIPLISSLLKLSDTVNLRIEAQTFVTEAIANAIPEAKLASIDLIEHTSDHVKFNGVIVLPEEIDFYEEARDSIRSALSARLNRDVSLDLEVLRIASIVSKASDTVAADEQIRDIVRSKISTALPRATLVRLDILKREVANEWNVRTLIALPADQHISSDKRVVIEKEISALLPQYTLSYSWTVLPLLSTQKDPSAEELFLREQISKWQTFLQGELPADALVKNLQISWDPIDTEKPFSKEELSDISVVFDIHVPSNQVYLVNNIKGKISDFASTEFSNEAAIEYNIYPYTKARISTEEK